MDLARRRVDDERVHVGEFGVDSLLVPELAHRQKSVLEARHVAYVVQDEPAAAAVRISADDGEMDMCAGGARQ